MLISAEALKSLQDIIIKQDIYMFNKTSKQSLQRYIQKLANTTQISFAKGAFQQDQIRFLIIINDEAKVRRSTKSVVLGKAKVISYKDLIAKRTERKAKEQEKAKGIRKHGQKRKSPEEAGTPEPKAKIARISEAQVEEDKITLELQRALVARI